MTKNQKEQLVKDIKNLGFAGDGSPLTVEQATRVVSLLFPVKACSFYMRRSNYGLKHIIERAVNHYCDNEVMKQALWNNGFESIPAPGRAGNEFFNVCGVGRLNNLFQSSGTPL